MDKYERKVRVNQIISLIDKDEYGEALDIADTIDWRTEKSVRTLRMVSEVYKINRQYGDAFNVLTIAYERDPDDPIKRKIVYDLCEIAIKLDQYAYAVKYLKEFVKLSPNDPGRYILQYKLLKVTGAEYAERIEVLEEFKKNYFGDFLEKWAYELALLYYQTGQSQQCINACDEIILWFVKGPYVNKAKELKASFVKDLGMPQGTSGNDTYKQEEVADNSYVSDASYGQQSFDTGNMQYEQQTFNGMQNGYDGQQYAGNGQQYAGNGQENNAQGYQTRDGYYGNDQNYERPREEQTGYSQMPIEIRNVYASNEPTIRMPDKQINDFAMNGQETEISINVDKYSTINLQAELKANIDELEEQTGEVMRQPEESISEPDIGMTEIFNENDPLPEPEIVEVQRAEEVRDVPVYRQEPSGETLYRTEETHKPTVIKKTEFGESLPRMPQQYRNMLSEEYDGQLNLNVPDEPARLEKQITGQMDLATVLSQWEEVRRESKRRRFETITPSQVSRAEEARQAKVTPSRIPRPDKNAAPSDEQKDVPVKEEAVREEPVQKLPAESGVREYRKAEKEESWAPEAAEEEPVYSEEEIEEEVVEKTEFTEDEREVFAPFISIGGMEDKLLWALSRVSMTGSRGNVIITGNEATLRIAMAQSLARDQQLKNSYMGIKVAKINADVFNTKDIAKSLRALDGNVLVVEKAGRLSGETISKMLSTLRSDGLSLLVILEDNKNSLRNLPVDNDIFNRVFSIEIEIPRFSNDDLVQHARDYARQQEYLIDEMAVLALYRRIDEKQTADHLVTAAEVEAIVDDAIRHVNKKNMSHLMDVLFAKRYNEDDLIIIREKDFEKK